MIMARPRPYHPAVHQRRDRDRSSLELPGRQAQLVEAMATTGTPVVLVLVVARPISLAGLREHRAAILVARPYDHDDLLRFGRSTRTVDDHGVPHL